MIYFYDGQIRRFVAQFVRLFSGFAYKAGVDANGNTMIRNIPVKYAETNRQASFILRDNSLSSMLAIPSMACYINGLTYNRERVQEPNHVSKVHIRERQYDLDTNSYTTNQGQGYTVERLMPVPFDLSMVVDIWTSSIDQKLQILEQLLVWFNPSMEIQTSNNFVDWTSLSLVELTDVSFSSRTIPVGVEDQYDIATLTFNIPIWITPPAKVKKLGVIQTIMANIYDESGALNEDIVSGELLSRQYITPTNFDLLLIDGVARLLAPSDTVSASNNSLNVPDKLGSDLSWDRIISLYGELKDGISQLRLTKDDGTDIIGTVSRDPLDVNLLNFEVDPDTISTNTLDAVNAIINPLTKAPGHGLPAASVGQRYLLVDDIGNAVNEYPAAAWGNIVALANDIISYDGSVWAVSFDSSNHNNEEYMTNSFTNIQYKWTGNQWNKSYEGEWASGSWTIVI